MQCVFEKYCLNQQEPKKNLPVTWHTRQQWHVNVEATVLTYHTLGSRALTLLILMLCSKNVTTSTIS